MRFAAFFSLSILVIATSCSILKKDDPEKAVREFLTVFQKNLMQPDEQILKQFEARQPEYVIVQILRILQNKESTLITAQTNFAGAIIASVENAIRVDIPVTLQFDESKGADRGQAMLTFWLSSRDKSFVITKIEGETLYQEYTSLKNRNEWVVEERIELEKRAAYYATAQALEKTYDSVVWYTKANDMTYYYVVTGDWQNDLMQNQGHARLPTGVRMGLVDSLGALVIPIEYDLVGTIGFDQPNIVEVYKAGMVGYYDIKLRELVVDPVYDMIIPYGIDNIYAIVKQDSVYGWLDHQQTYFTGFPTESIERWVTTFEYLKKPVSLKAENQFFCEIPDMQHMGNGIVMPPSYFVAHGLFDAIESGICTTSIPINGWTEYRETKGTIFERLTANLNAVITTVRERYLEGREEFYTSNKLVFVNARQDTVNVAEVAGDSIAIVSIDSALLEVRTPHDYWFMENDLSVENNLMNYCYFRIDGNGIIKKQISNRLFAQTEFVRLDSSYVTGEFQVYNSETEENDTYSVLSLKTLSSMRNEILASYGYIFQTSSEDEHFRQYKWYVPRFDNVADFEQDISAIDKHNLAFLENIMLRLSSNLAMND